MTAPPGSILLVGGGRMGSAMAAGWLRGSLEAAHLAIVEPDDDAAARLAPLGALRVPAADALPRAQPPAAIVFAVKPQAMADAVPRYAGIGGADCVHLSIAAGWPIALLERDLGRVPIVRAMPNTPAAIGQGVSVACANRGRRPRPAGALRRPAPGGGRRRLGRGRSADGRGDGRLGQRARLTFSSSPNAWPRPPSPPGLPTDLARMLADRTVSGAGALLARSDEDAATLRRNVTSPGGTTEAALSVLMAADGLGPLMTRAVRAATERSRALAPD